MKYRYPYLSIYLAVVFGVAWSLMIGCTIFADFLTPLIGPLTLTHPVVIFILYLPSVTGVAIYGYAEGMKGVKGIMKKLIPRRQDWVWFPILAVIFIGFALSMRLGSILLRIDTPVITDTLTQMFTKALWNFIEETGLIGGIFGWIGFVLPYLQKKFQKNIPSALLTGLLFGLWIMPGYGLSSWANVVSYGLYVFQLMAFICFASYVFNATAGNLSCYLFAFWLAATGSHIQLYYFNTAVQAMELVFLTLATVLIHFSLKKLSVKSTIQMFPDFIYSN